MTAISTAQTDGGDAGYEKRDISAGRVILYGLVGVIAVVLVIVFVMDYFAVVTEEAVQEAVLKPESVALRELRARENEELTSYARLDSAAGVYRIPIARAIEVMADEAYQAQKTQSR